MAKGSGSGAGAGGGSGGRAAPAPQVQDFTGERDSLASRFRRNYSASQERTARDIAEQIRRATGTSVNSLLNNYTIGTLIKIRDAIKAGKQVKLF